MTMGVVLFVTAPTSAFILGVHAVRAGHRSGKIAVMVSGLLLLATLAVLAWGIGWIGPAVTAVVAVLVLACVRSLCSAMFSSRSTSGSVTHQIQAR
jgi:hypothetical protein